MCLLGVLCLILINHLAIAVAIAITMATPLAPPKGFEFHRYFFRPNSNIASTSQVSSSDIIVPFMNLEGSEQPTTPIGDNTSQKRSYDKNRQLQLL